MGFCTQSSSKDVEQNAETRHVHSANPPPNRVSSVLFAGLGSFALVFALLRLGKHTLGRPANHHNFMIAHTLSCSWDRVRIGDIWGDRGSRALILRRISFPQPRNLARRRQISRPLDIEVGFETFEADGGFCWYYVLINLVLRTMVRDPIHGRSALNLFESFVLCRLLSCAQLCSAVLLSFLSKNLDIRLHLLRRLHLSLAEREF